MLHQHPPKPQNLIFTLSSANSEKSNDENVDNLIQAQLLITSIQRKTQFILYSFYP